ncbi:MAG: TIGR00341 family protein [Candidatus Latescibacterota bacterium]|nr:MAG: TIGR00341 family protein [Candidatus Latescibacterota bacterium]
MAQPWTEELSSGVGRARVLLPAERTEIVLDALQQRFGSRPGFRVLLLRVEATLPKLAEEDDEQDTPAAATPKTPDAKDRSRISREELYQDIVDSARLSSVFLITVSLSTLVAAMGLIRGDVAIVIGAMVIAPLLGPNVALALATTLGDVRLASRSLRTLGAGIVVAGALAFFIGVIIPIEPLEPQLLARTELSLSDVLVAFAAGTTGALAFTTGLPTALIGVMVAVALLPPLVAAGLLLGASQPALALRAAALLLTNVACVNLAGVITFFAQHIRPRTWWEEQKAKKSVRVAIASWVAVLSVLVVLILLFWND